MGAGWEAREGSPELLLLRQEGCSCSSSFWERGIAEPRAAGAGSGRLGRTVGRDCLEGQTKLSELSGILSGYDDWVMYNTFAK